MLSHLGSGAVIMQRRLEDTLAGQAMPDDYAPGVWDTWNAKTPVEQRDDALAIAFRQQVDVGHHAALGQPVTKPAEGLLDALATKQRRRFAHASIS